MVGREPRTTDGAAEDQAARPAGPWPFVTRARARGVGGTAVLWESRPHRKHHNRLDTGRGSTWWAPGAVAWWIGILFMVGAACFALGALPGYASAVGATADDATFFFGSVFFTSAALLQYLEVVNARDPGEDPASSGNRRWWSWEPQRIDWWSSAVQLLGTLAFNVSTLVPLLGGLGVAETDRWVWRPDAVGSVAFLVASALAWAEAGHAWASWRPRSISWWIALLNLTGSIAFGVSAVGAYVVPESGELRNATAANLGTFVGALCFLAGAFLLLPERTRPD